MAEQKNFNTTKKKILVVLTGGTICSRKDANKESQSYASKAKEMIIDNYLSSNSPVKDGVSFETVSLKEDVLSENMTIDVWNELLRLFSDKTIWTDNDGIIVLHGTDTLAYTSALLSIALAGAPIPICMVSAQLDLFNKNTNGYMNFKASVELIVNGIEPNVYAVYRNMKTDRSISEPTGAMLVHYGAHLMQCSNYSSNFYSIDAMEITDLNNARLQGKAFETDTFYIEKIKELTPSVLAINSYVGLRYSSFNLDGVKAILHGTYHSDTVCVERKSPNATNDNFTDYSILYLLKKAKEKDIPVFLSPCNENAYTYVSTGDAIRNGALGITGTTFELAYVKLLVGLALSLSGADLREFMEKSINFEFAY